SEGSPGQKKQPHVGLPFLSVCSFIYNSILLFSRFISANLPLGSISRLLIEDLALGSRISVLGLVHGHLWVATRSGIPFSRGFSPRWITKGRYTVSCFP